jgi:hypothetical protein
MSFVLHRSEACMELVGIENNGAERNEDGWNGLSRQNMACKEAVRETPAYGSEGSFAHPQCLHLLALDIPMTMAAGSYLSRAP